MRPAEIRIDGYDYPLPDSRIALHPLAERDACKLLVRNTDGTLTDTTFGRLDELLPNDAVLIYNNTRVINARLRFRKGADRMGASIEIFCLEPVSPKDYALNFASSGPVEWTCFVGNSKRWKDDALTLPLSIEGREVILTAERVGKSGNSSTVRFSWNSPDVSFSAIIEAAGEIPIPPYLNRSTEETDKTDYQTVFSNIEGSVAAPTAGLHFTDRLLDRIAARDIPRREVTLHVGAGTFQPVKTDTIGEHEMHSEFIAVNRSLIEELVRSRRRVVAVGTTSVRTLESLYHLGCMAASGQEPTQLDQWYPYSESHPNLNVGEAMEALLRYLDRTNQPALVASTRLLIAPGYNYRIVKGIITNFHQPRSTLLLLVSAFIGPDWRDVYDHALASNYRFLSYGDACLFL